MAFLTTAVFEHRLRELRSLMDREALDAIALTGADFYQYASNYHLDVRTWERPVLLVVPREGEPFTLLNSLSTNHFKMACERGTMWVTDATFYFEHPVERSNAYHVHEFGKLVADLLGDRGLAAARIGCDGTPAQFDQTRQVLPTLDLRNVSSALRELRWVKHPEEIAIMRELARLSDWLQDRYREHIRPGRLLQELDRSMAALMFEEGARRFPGENLEMLACYTLSGPASASPHGNGAQTGAVIANGDGLVNILVPRLNGLVIENERTWFCGAPSTEQTRLFETARAANEAAIEEVVAGRPVSGIDAAARKVIEDAGYGEHIIHRTGHGIGILGHEFPEDMAFNDRPLLAGEVYSAEPGIYVYGLGGFRFDDTVVVADAPDVLTHAPKDLISQTVG